MAIDMNTGTFFESSMTTAEKACFDYLASATHASPGKNAHVGRSVGLLNAWWFGFAEIPRAYGAQFEGVGTISNIAQYASAEGRFEKRADAQAWLMRIIGACPWSDVQTTGGNVAELRIRADGVREITSEWQKTKDDKTYGVWISRVEFDVVFLTGVQHNGNQ